MQFYILYFRYHRGFVRLYRVPTHGVRIIAINLCRLSMYFKTFRTAYTNKHVRKKKKNKTWHNNRTQVLIIIDCPRLYKKIWCPRASRLSYIQPEIISLNVAPIFTSLTSIVKNSNAGNKNRSAKEISKNLRQFVSLGPEHFSDAFAANPTLFLRPVAECHCFFFFFLETVLEKQIQTEVYFTLCTMKSNLFYTHLLAIEIIIQTNAPGQAATARYTPLL